MTSTTTSGDTRYQRNNNNSSNINNNNNTNNDTMILSSSVDSDNNEILMFSPMEMDFENNSNNNNNHMIPNGNSNHRTIRQSPGRYRDNISDHDYDDDTNNDNDGIMRIDHRHNMKYNNNHDDDDDTNNNRFSPSSKRQTVVLDYEDNLLEDHEQILFPVNVVPITTHWYSSFMNWLYPASTPIECQLFRKENIAVPACYLLVGLLQGLSAPLINVLPLDLGASEAQQATVSSIRSLPSSFKLIFGFWSDTVPIMGYRRKPYMLIGWCLASLSLLMLLMFSNLHIPARNAGCFVHDNDIIIINNNTATDTDTQTDDDHVIMSLVNTRGIDNDTLGAPSIPFLSLCLLGFGIGFWLADVMGDSIVAEKAKLELPEHRGSLQSTCYSCRFFGIMVAAPLSTYLYSAVGPYYVVLLLSIMPLTIVPLIYMLYEQQHGYIAPVRTQCNEIWNTVCSRAVWQPMGFVYLYNVLQVGNSAWREFLVTSLHFTSCQLNLLLIVAYVLLYLGIVSYKQFFIHWSWRKVYIATTLLGGFFSLLQVCLITGNTFGLSPFLFALGDDAFGEFITGVQFLPTTIMMVHLCPDGSEGASYAMFTTVNNSALNLSGAISTQLLKIWDVSRTALETGHYSGMIKLTYFTTFVQVSAIIFVGWLPRYKEDLMALKSQKHSISSMGGTIFLIITFASILYAMIIGFLNIVAPGWMGET